MRGYKSSGEQDWIKVLNALAMAEMYVPYGDGTEIHDIAHYQFPFVRAKSNYIPGAGIVRGGLQADGYTIAEIVDENVR